MQFKRFSTIFCNSAKLDKILMYDFWQSFPKFFTSMYVILFVKGCWEAPAGSSDIWCLLLLALVSNF